MSPSEELRTYLGPAITAAAEDGWEDLRDQNAVHKDGYFPIPMNNIDGKRISASTAYLTRDVRARPNFTLWSETLVERLLFDGSRVIGVILIVPKVDEKEYYFFKLSGPTDLVKEQADSLRTSFSGDADSEKPFKLADVE